jgi:uncharacterized RDD family membrane protein YckC
MDGFFNKLLEQEELTMTNTSLLRRFGAIIYDALLALALLFLGTLPFIGARGGESVDPGNSTYQIFMLLILFVFFVGFWAGYGRTLGMQSWRLKIETELGTRPTYTQAGIRFFAAILSWLPLGLGFFWQLWDKDGLAWHDRLSGTRLRYYPKE